MTCVEFVAEYIVLENAVDITSLFQAAVKFYHPNVCLFTWSNMVGRNKVT